MARKIFLIYVDALRSQLLVFGKDDNKAISKFSLACHLSAPYPLLYQF